MSFYYQELDVYYIALGFVDNVLDVTKTYGPVPNNLLRRLEKTAVEIPLVIAHSAGEDEKGITVEGWLKIRGCVFECQAMLELLWRRKLIKDKHSDELGETLIVLANMLTDLAASSDTTRTVPIYRQRRRS